MFTGELMVASKVAKTLEISGLLNLFCWAACWRNFIAEGAPETATAWRKISLRVEEKKNGLSWRLIWLKIKDFNQSVDAWYIDLLTSSFMMWKTYLEILFVILK
mgnify:CR=1 FL=1